MADYSNNYKPSVTKQFPKFATKDGVAGFSRVEPFLTVERLKKEFLFGIPLVSPITKEKLDDDTIKAIINKSATAMEMRTGIDFTLVQRFKRIDFDRTKYLQGWNQLLVGFPNIRSIEEVAIRAVNSTSIPEIPSRHPQQNMTSVSPLPDNTYGDVLFSLPLSWIDMSYADRGILHLVPLQTTYTGTGIVGGATTGAYAPLFAIFTKLAWIPSFWSVRVTCGFSDNAFPSPVNQLIGTEAAIQILSMLSTLHRYTSKSIGIDGASQGLGLVGPQIYILRIQQLEADKAELIDMIKHHFSAGLIMSNI
jgi:hypothetical protein